MEPDEIEAAVARAEERLRVEYNVRGGEVFSPPIASYWRHLLIGACRVLLEELGALPKKEEDQE